MNKALFLDRDGIINVDKGYVYRFEDIIWIPETLEMIRLANQNNYKVIVVTNQSGVERGKYTEADVEILHQKMTDSLKARGLIIDDWFYCSSLQSESRKPRPGMLYAAEKKHNIDLEQSFMVGDKASDVFVLDENKKGPFTFIVKGNYEINLNSSVNVRVCETHQDILDELKKRL